MTLTGLKNRIIADYFVPSRGAQYRNILKLALLQGYKIMSLSEYYLLRKNNQLGGDKKILCLRHDVDIINPKATRAFYLIEKELGVTATYYFRLYTVDHNLSLLAELHADEFEVGYHFEELATYAKTNAIRDSGTLSSCIPQVRDIFIDNFRAFKEKYAPNAKSICSHGDWINVRFDMRNWILITPEILSQLNLEFETYQESFLSLFDAYISDVATYPERWAKGYPAELAIENGEKRICMLTHERFWYTNPYRNSMANLKSVTEQIQYRIGK